MADFFTRGIGATIFLIGAVFSPKISTSQPETTTSTPSIEFARISPELTNYGAVDQSALWTRNIISVCWLDNTEFLRERSLVRMAVTRTWEAASSVRFTGWENCTPAGADIRIQIDDSGPRSYVGMQSIRRSPSMWLNFTFNQWSENCRSIRDLCIQSIAVHEFGHALGFQHEQLRSDAPQACVEHLRRTTQWEVLSRPPTPLTVYDSDSVMNYCNSIYNNNGVLSEKDRQAISILFPRRQL